jgi:hypothetical protein
MSGKWIEVSTIPQAFENPFAYRSGNKRNRNGKLTQKRITKAISNEMARVEQTRATSWQAMSVTQLKQRSAVASTTDLDGSPQFPTIDEALSGPHVDGWEEAMRSEINELLQLHTWEVVSSVPPNKTVIGFKWALRTKHDKHGKFVKFKARLTAKGYAQRKGVDFNEVFAPVARFTSIRLLLSIAAAEGLHLRQLDVTGTFQMQS